MFIELQHVNYINFMGVIIYLGAYKLIQISIKNAHFLKN